MTAIQESAGFFRLRGLLEAGNWRAEDAMLAQALPHFIDQLDPVDTIAALENLGINASGFPSRTDKISTADCPALFQPKTGPMIGILDRDGARFLIHDPDAFFPAWRDLPATEGVLITLGKNDATQEIDDEPAGREVRGLRRHLAGFTPVLVTIFFVALLTNLLAFAPAVFIMVLYDRVIPTG